MEGFLCQTAKIVALRNEKGSYNAFTDQWQRVIIVALRNEKGSYNNQKRKRL